MLSLSSFGDCGRGNGEDGGGVESLASGGGDPDNRHTLFGDEVAIGGKRSECGRIDKAGGGDEDPERMFGGEDALERAGELGLDGRACLRLCDRLGEVELRRI